MFVGLLHLELRIAESHSLKEKRQVVQSLIETTRRRFNASVAEVDHLDAWQMAGVGVACVANERRHLDQVLAKIESHVESDPRVEIVRSGIEIL